MAKTAISCGVVLMFAATASAAEAAEIYKLKGAKDLNVEFLDLTYQKASSETGLEVLRPLYADVTSIHYSNERGVQYEYTGEDGTAHQWMAGTLEILKGQWKLTQDRKGAMICFAYTGSVSDVEEEDFECGSVKSHQAGATDRIKGDFMNLATRDEGLAVLPKGARFGRSQMTLEQELTSLPYFNNRRILRDELTGKLDWYKGKMGGVDLDGVYKKGKPYNVLFYAGEALCTLEDAEDCGYEACKADRKVSKEFKAYKKQLEGMVVILKDPVGLMFPGGRVALEADVFLADGRKLTDAYVEAGWGFRPGDVMPDRFWRKAGCGAPLEAPKDQGNDPSTP